MDSQRAFREWTFFHSGLFMVQQHLTNPNYADTYSLICSQHKNIKQESKNSHIIMIIT